MALSLRDIGFRLGYDLDKQSEAKVENSIKSLKNTATKLLGAIGIGFSLTKIISLSEEFNGINDKINYATKGMGDQKEVQQAILKAANDTKTSYAGMADTVSQLVQVNKDLFPLDDAVEFASVTQKLLIAAGKSESEATSLQSTIAKTFQTGQVSSAVLRNLYNQAPEVINVIADSLGVASDTLYDLADQGVLTGETIKEAMLGASASIEADFNGLDYSISDAMLNARNSWGYFIDDLNSTLGVTQTIAQAITRLSGKAIEVANKIKSRVEWLADKLGGTDKLLRLIAVSAAAIFVALNAGKILDFMKSVGSLLNAGSLKTLAIVAAIVLLALLVEDFIAFMRGEDSFIGSMLEKAGINSEEVREKIIAAWTAVKNFLSKVWQVIKSVATSVWNGLKQFWADHGEQIKAGLTKAWEVIKTVLVTVWNIIKTVATSVFEGLRNFWEKHGEQIKTAFSNIWQGIKNIVTTIWNIIKTIAVTVFNALKSFWETWGDTIMTWFSGVWETIKAVFSAVLDALADIFAIFAAVFAGDWEGAWEAVKTFFSDLWDNIVNIFTTVWTTITSTLESIWNTVSDKVSGIKDTIVDGFNAAIEFITSLPSKALQWGKDIIQNIIDGIKSKIAAVGEAVSGVANTIKSFLGFSEPEDGPLSDFHTYMPDMIALMTSGIEAGRAKVKEAFGDLAGDMSIMAKANLVSGGTAAMATTNSTVSKSVVQNNNFSSTFNGDRAGQQKSATAMSAASDDAVSYMARALAVAR